MKLLVIAGPTGTGKTRLSVMAAHALGGEVVNADAMQVYRGMDIGTAKPTIAEREGVPHHMFDVAEPGQPYSVSRYIEDARPIIADIFERGKVPVIVGGTGLYIDSLLYDREFADTDPELRRQLETLPDPFAELLRVDPDTTLHSNDRRRIIRALEVFRLTGKTISEIGKINLQKIPIYYYKKFILAYKNRNRLYDTIDRRVVNMVSNGLIDEVRGLLEKNISTQAIGYKEFAAAISENTDFSAAIQTVQQASRNYAKRQLTWFRRDTNAAWIEWDDEPDFDYGLNRILTEFDG